MDRKKNLCKVSVYTKQNKKHKTKNNAELQLMFTYTKCRQNVISVILTLAWLLVPDGLV